MIGIGIKVNLVCHIYPLVFFISFFWLSGTYLDNDLHLNCKCRLWKEQILIFFGLKTEERSWSKLLQLKVIICFVLCTLLYLITYINSILANWGDLNLSASELLAWVFHWKLSEVATNFYWRQLWSVDPRFLFKYCLMISWWCSCIRVLSYEFVNISVIGLSIVLLELLCILAYLKVN